MAGSGPYLHKRGWRQGVAAAPRDEAPQAAARPLAKDDEGEPVRV
ncbi:hypothetical protein GCM10009601_31730 [Streptomyces thermospinosisporus]|uniref:Uncharacterized protein n=1 Tax=Streptomyces thermospinosisporus TaxID=161482 RepID=A0ABN1YY71_9ACTN